MIHTRRSSSIFPASRSLDIHRMYGRACELSDTRETVPSPSDCSCMPVLHMHGENESLAWQSSSLRSVTATYHPYTFHQRCIHGLGRTCVRSPNSVVDVITKHTYNRKHEFSFIRKILIGRGQVTMSWKFSSSAPSASFSSHQYSMNRIRFVVTPPLCQ